MAITDILTSGDFNGAVAEFTAQVKADPEDADARVNLAALLVMMGAIDRAESHLNALAARTDLGPGVLVYQGLLQAEEERRRVYEDGAACQCAPTSPESTRLRSHALPLLAKGAIPELTEAVEAARRLEAPRPGSMDGTRFTELTDYDEFLGPHLETYVGGRFMLRSLSEFRSIRLEAPRYLMDRVWRAAELIDLEGNTARMHIPALYAGSSASEDGLVRTGRKTEWKEIGSFFRGSGLRTWQVDELEVPLLEATHVEFDVRPAAEPPNSGTA